MKPVLVVWLDTTVQHGWVEDPQNATPSRCETLGFIVKETEEMITLAQTCCEEQGVCNLTCIPAGMVVDIKDL